MNEAGYPDLKWIYAIPNGGHRSPATAGRMKAEGVKRGISDICLPFRDWANSYLGAYIELKDGRSKKTTPEQKEFLEFIQKQGYFGGVAYSCDEMLDMIESYCGIKLRGRR